MNQEVSWGLKPRDFRILRMIVQDKGRKKIAYELCISDSWVSKELTRIYRQIGVQGIVGAAVWAVRHLGKEFGESEEKTVLTVEETGKTKTHPLETKGGAPTTKRGRSAGQ